MVSENFLLANFFDKLIKYMVNNMKQNGNKKIKMEMEKIKWDEMG
jgi:hypothetical protein